MNWLDKLVRGGVRKTPEAQATPSPAARPRPPAVDTGALRLALAASADPADTDRLAAELGAALGAGATSPDAGDDARVRAAAACAATDRPYALGLAGGDLPDEQLAQIALHGRFAELRLAAARRIGGQSMLEHVARESRHKDNNVYQQCSEVLRLRRQAQEQAQAASRLASELEQLLAVAPLPVSRLLELEKEFKSLDATQIADLPAAAQCAALIERADARVRQDADERRALLALAASAEALDRELSASDWPDATILAGWEQRHAALADSASRIAPWLAQQASAQALGAELQRAGAKIRHAAEDLARAGACERFIEDWRQRCSAPAGPAAEAQAGETQPAANFVDAEAEAEWNGMAKPGHAAARDGLEARWRALPRAVTRPAETPAPPPAPRPAPVAPPAPRIDAGALRGQLDALEGALDQGHLADAEAAARQIKTLVGQAELRGELDSRHQRAQARLAQLRGWASWGADRKREELLASAAALLEGEHSVEHLATAVPALREEWKKLATQGPSGKEQWESFDAALTQAFKPVLRRREEEAAARKRVREAKEALCSGWEAEWAAVGATVAGDEVRADVAADVAANGAADVAADAGAPFAALVALAAFEPRRQQIVAEWRAAPVAGFRDERQLRKRFDSLIASIDGRLAGARESEQNRREQLIAEAESLKERADVRSAIAQAKALQEQWKERASPVRLPRGAEQSLWRRFRAACDAVFVRRDAERAEQQAQRGRQLQELRERLDAFEAAVRAPEAGDLKRALAQFRSDWDAAAGDARALDDAMGRRARDLQRQAQARIDSARSDRYRDRLRELARKTPSTEGADPAALAEGRAARETLLIDLEVALGLPTPPEFSAARQRRQLEMLRGRFRSGPAASSDPEQLLARWYEALAEPDEVLTRRVESVIARLTERHATAQKA